MNAVPSDTYLLWTYASVTLSGHPQAVFTYSTTLTASDGSFLDDIAIPHYQFPAGNTLGGFAGFEVFVANPVLSIAKACPIAIEDNSGIDYLVTITNSGHENAAGVTAVDVAPAGVSFATATASSGSVTITPGEVSWTGTVPAEASVTIDIHGSVSTGAAALVNTAVITSAPAASNIVLRSASCSTLILHPAISVVKFAKPTIVSNLNTNTITVHALVTNTGDTGLVGVAAIDSIFGAYTCPSTTLGVGASMNCSGTYVIPLGTPFSFSNDTVVASGTDMLGTTVHATANASVAIVHPSIRVTKAVTPNEVSDLQSNTIDVFANVTNTGDSPVIDLVVVDNLAGPLICGTTSLGPGAMTSCTGSYGIPEGTPAGFSNDTVVAIAQDGFGNAVGPAFAMASVQIFHPAIGITKSVSPTVVSNLVANTIDVTTTVTNTGDFPVSLLTVDDSLAGFLTCGVTSLAPTASTTCTGTYVIPAGTTANFSNDTATAMAQDSFDEFVGPVSAHASVRIVHPSLSIAKAVDPTVVSDLVANTIDVTATVKNTGDATITGLVVIDSLAGALVCLVTTLAPGGPTTCTGSYVIPAGSTASYSNDTATVTGQDGFGHTVGPDSAHASVLIVHPGLSIRKSVDPSVVSSLVANTITVTANVTNTGDTTVSDLVVIDSLAGPLVCGTTTLAPGMSTNCTGTYLIPAGTTATSSPDTATVTGQDGFGNTVGPEIARASVTIVHPAVGITKAVNPSIVSDLVANTIEVTATVTNTGDSPISGLVVTDTLAGPLSCLTTTLAPGASTTCTGSYLIPAGTTASFSNDTATVTADDGFGHTVGPESANASVQIVHPSIGITKSVSPSVVSNLVANTIHVTATVTNTGDATIVGLAVSDSLAGVLTCLVTTLAPGASTTCTGTYIIPVGTSASFSNDTATATAQDEFDQTVGPVQAKASVAIVHPSVEITKSVSPPVVSDLVPNVVHVTATVTNTGDVTIVGLVVIDSVAGALTCLVTTLASGASTTCTGSYTIAAGNTARFSNDTATVTAGDGFGHTVGPESANASVQIVHPSIGITKSVNPTVVSNLVSNTIAVTATVTNLGDSTIHNLVVTDSLAGTLTCLVTTLAPGASTTCTGSYTISAGTTASFSNDTATATAQDEFDHTVGPVQAKASVAIVHPSLGIAKSVSPTLVSNLVANTIAVTTVVTNTGDSTIHGLAVIDSLAGALTCLVTTLAPGASTTCTGSYTIPAGTAASFSNDTATVTGLDLFGHTVGPANAKASVQIVHPKLGISKSVSPSTVSNSVATTITVTATVTNTGDSTITGLAVTDSLAGALTCLVTTLAPGASTTCTGTYTIPAGTSASFSNDTATGRGIDVTGQPVGPVNATASVTIVHPKLGIAKSVSPTVVSNSVANTIAVTATVTNLGDSTIHNLVVTDSLAGTLTCLVTTLAPGASTTCTGSYTISAGTTASFSNDTATATGLDIDGNLVGPVNASASVRIVHAGSSEVTDTQFCPLPSTGFRLLINPGGTLTSSNPGQFYYNIFDFGGLTTGTQVTMTIPFPFVTQGAVPIQVFENQGPPACPSSVPGSNVNGQFTISPPTFDLTAYAVENFGSSVKVTFTLTGSSIPSGNLLWFSAHLAYGLKGMTFRALAPGSSGCPTPANTGPCAQLTSNAAVIIGNPQGYAFSNNVFGANPVASTNAFNRALSPAGWLGPVAGGSPSRAGAGVALLVAAGGIALLALRGRRRGSPGSAPGAEEAAAAVAQIPAGCYLESKIRRRPRRPGPPRTG